MLLAMKHDESLDPLDLGILGADAVMQHPNRFPNAIEHLRPAIGERLGTECHRWAGLVCIIHGILVVRGDFAAYNRPDALDYTSAQA
jgi:hypothetical protein